MRASGRAPLVLLLCCLFSSTSTLPQVAHTATHTALASAALAAILADSLATTFTTSCAPPASLDLAQPRSLPSSSSSLPPPSPSSPSSSLPLLSSTSTMAQSQRQALAPLDTNSTAADSPATREKRSYTQITPEWRQRLIQRRYNDHASISSIAKEHHLHKSTVWHIMRQFEDHGREDKPRTGGNVKNVVFGAREKASLLSFVDEHAQATLADAQDHLRRSFPSANPPAISTIDRALAGAHYHLKRLEVQSEERNSPEKMANRKKWVEDQIGVALNDAVYIDEAGFNLHLSRRRGRAAAGERAVQYMPKRAGKNMTLIVACSPTDGVLAAGCHIGGTKAGLFAQRLQEVVLPAIESRSRLLIMDNVRFHHSKEPKDVIEKAGHRILYIPAYTPHFNIAEWVFSSLKTRVSRREAKDHGQLEDFIASRLHEITAEHCQGFFRDARRWQQAALAGQPMGETHEAPVPQPTWVRNSFESSQGSSRTAGSQQSSDLSSAQPSSSSQPQSQLEEDLEQEQENQARMQPESQL